MTTKVTSEFLDSAIISDHTQVSAASADHILIHDASDNTLKKALVSTITGSGTTINNNADNRIITGSGTSGTLEAETDLTYSGGANAVGTLEKATSHLSLKASNALFLTRGDGHQVSFYKGSDSAPHFTISTPTISGSTNQTELRHRGDLGGDLILSTVDTSGTIRRGITIKGDSNGDIELIGDITKTSGDITIDVPGSINLDADNNGEVSFRDGGTEYGKIFSSSSDFAFEAGVQDKDIIFRGNDGGTAITPFKLDMSTGGRALFYSDLLALETAGQYLQVAGSSSTYWAIGSTGGNNPPGTASTTLAFHHYDGSAWNNEVEFDSSGNITLDGSIVFSNNSKLRQDSAGLIMETLDSDEDLLFIGNDGGNVIIAARMDMSDSGHLICNNNITAFGNTSDIKLKENIEIISNPLDKVKQLKGVTFNYKKDGKRSTGLIAQDLEKVLPEVVYEVSDIDNDEEKHLAVRYGNTVGLLVEAIKELEARVKELESK